MPNRKIFDCIHAIQDEMSKEGISKDRKNAQQGYSFRGIDDVLNVLSPLFAKHKVFAVPRIEFTGSERLETKSGGTVEHSRVAGEFEFFSVEDGSSLIVKVPGQAMDSADKATNKAISAAFKYACFLLFCIPVDVEDADATTHEVLPPKKTEKKDPPKFSEPFNRMHAALDFIKANGVNQTDLDNWKTIHAEEGKKLPENEKNIINKFFIELQNSIKKG